MFSFESDLAEAKNYYENDAASYPSSVPDFKKAYDDAESYHKWCRNTVTSDPEEAFKIAEAGSSLFPNDVKLAGDLIVCSAMMGDWANAKKYIREQEERFPHCVWQAENFHNTIEALTRDGCWRHEEQIRSLIAEYHARFPWEEQAYSLEYEFEKAMGNYEVGLKVLERAVQTIHSSDACYKLAVHHLRRHEYQKVFYYALSGISASAAQNVDYPSTPVYFFFLICLGEDAALVNQYAEHKEIPRKSVKKVLDKYLTFEKNFSETIGFPASDVKQRIAVLQSLLDMLPESQA